MTTIEILNYTLDGIAIISALLTGLFFLIKPQQKTEVTDEGFKKDIDFIKADIINLRENHIHTLDQKVDCVIKTIGDMRVDVGKLATIIEERVPKKQ